MTARGKFMILVSYYKLNFSFFFNDIPYLKNVSETFEILVHKDFKAEADIISKSLKIPTENR